MHTLNEALERTVRHNRTRRALLDGDKTLTYGDFHSKVQRAAGVLTHLGLDVGSRFSILAFNSPLYEEIKWAGFRIGAIPVPLNWRLAPPEIAHILADSEAGPVLVDEAFLTLFDAPELKPWRTQVIPLGSSDDPSGYAKLLHGARPAPAALLSPDDDALLLYTGGTTGKAKGVRLTHWNILSNALAFGLSQQARPDDVYLHVIPMFHSADLLATAWFLIGAAHAYVPTFSPAVFLDAVSRYQITVTASVPTMLMMILNDESLAAADISSLRTLMFGGAPMDPEWIRRVCAAFPRTGISNCYGLTETAPNLVVADPREFRNAIELDAPAMAAIGKPNALVELRVVDAAGSDVPVGEPGELWARGPNVSPGYLNLPVETAEVFVDGWFHTGDITRIDEAGYVYLLDRVKDLIISGGENIYSSEVEAALYRNETVEECAVIGVPHERFGESVLAIIVLRKGADAREEDIVNHCRVLIGGYKVPRRIVFVDKMPKSALGKILKAELRSQFAEN